MKKLQFFGRIVLFSIFCSIMLQGFAQGDSLNMTRVGTWADSDTSTYYNDIWGYAADGREYAIMGSNHSTYFFDVTDDTPVLINTFPGKSNNVIWRDYKVYGHYAYGVADGANNSLQIFDLSDLPNSVTKISDSQEFTTSTHNIFIDGDRLYMGINTRFNGSTYALDVLSLADPTAPTLLTNVPATYFSNSSVHDIYVRNDTAYCSGEYAGLFIYDLTDVFNPVFISSITVYEDQGYNHSSWLSEDGNTLVMADEVPSGLAMKLFDVSDVTNPTYLTKFESHPDARPHNPFFRQNKIIISYYLDGVQVFDASDPSNPFQSAYYDTYPDNDTSAMGSVYPPDAFDGCWGVYPYLPSGRIVASDVTYGLVVLDTPELLGTNEPSIKGATNIQLYPNPVQQSDKVLVRSDGPIFYVSVSNELGQIVLRKEVQNRNLAEIDVKDLDSGLYLVQVFGKNGVQTRKLVVD